MRDKMTVKYTGEKLHNKIQYEKFIKIIIKQNIEIYSKNYI